MRCRPATIPVALVLWAFVIVTQGMAGPWARAAGEGFLAFSVTSDTPMTALATGAIVLDNYGGLYGEYGLGWRLTLGAQTGRSGTAEDAGVFLRYTLTAPDSPWQLAVDGGAGLRRETGGPERQLARIGLSVGRAFGGVESGRWWLPVSHDGGWITLDGIAMMDTRTAEVIWQAEGTIGLSLTDRLQVMVQTKVEDWPGGDMLYTVAPGAAWSLTDRTTAQIGARLGFGQSQTVGLAFGLWHSF